MSRTPAPAEEAGFSNVAGHGRVPPRGRLGVALNRTPFRSGSVGRSMVLVGGGSAIGQVATLLAAPVLARLYDPEAFGLLAVFSAVLAIGITVSSLRYDFAIPIAHDGEEALHLMVLSVLVALGVSAACGLVVALWGPTLAAAAGAEALVPYLWLLPVGIVFASATQALSSWAVYHQLYASLARLRVFQALVRIGAQVAFGLLAFGAPGLIVGDTIGRSLGTGHLVSSFARKLRDTRISVAKLRATARGHWGFARIMTAASTINAVTLQLPFLLIPAAFDLFAAGQYFLASRMLILPASFVSAAVYQVFFGEASARRGDPAELRGLVYRTAVSLFAIAIPTYGIATVVAPGAVIAIFGAEWALAGLYAQILAPSLILKTVTSPISSLLLVGRRERESLAFTTLELLLKGGALVVGALVHSLTIGVVLLSLTSIALSVGSLWRFLRVASLTLGDVAGPAVRTALVTAPVLALVALVVLAFPAGTLPVAAIGWIAALALAVHVARRMPTLRESGA